jgi:hypothetical protein
MTSVGLGLAGKHALSSRFRADFGGSISVGLGGAGCPIVAPNGAEWNRF